MNESKPDDNIVLGYFDCEQGSDEWRAIKLGTISATGIEKVLNKKTGRKTYMHRLLGERMTDTVEATFSNDFMKDGIDKEPMARKAYEEKTGMEVIEIGFVKNQKWVGCSPDGLVGPDGLVEIKCPLPSTHCRYILANVLPSEYRKQVQAQLWITGRDWCDFVSYHPDMKSQNIWIHRVLPDLEFHAEIAAGVEKFLAELSEMEKQLRDF